MESYPRASQTRPLTDAGLAVKPGDGPPYERSAIHHLSNRNKRNITLNLRHASALRSADRAFRFKALVKEIAERDGLRATFMGKPFNGDEGSGFHLHISRLYLTREQDVGLTHQEHFRIVDALEAGDPDAAAQAMRLHLEGSYDRLIK